MKTKQYYPNNSAETTIQTHLFLTFSPSLTCLGLSLGLSNDFPEALPKGDDALIFLRPVYRQSAGLRNLLLTAAILGPAGWIMAQGLDWVVNFLDTGSQTCGLDFIYGKDEGKEKEEKENEEEGNGEDETAEENHVEEENMEEENVEEDINKTMREGILSILFEKDIPFLFETGR